jgi:hypothetical protein
VETFPKIEHNETENENPVGDYTAEENYAEVDDY